MVIVSSLLLRISTPTDSVGTRVKCEIGIGGSFDRIASKGRIEEVIDWSVQ